MDPVVRIILCLISIHAPRMGGDRLQEHHYRPWRKISIHAPRMGGDRHCGRPNKRDRHFNPRPPHGGRRLFAAHSPSTSEFQSTPPAWGATPPTVNPSGREVFQSTPPAWGATYASRAVLLRPGISIHAPRMGGDCVSPPLGIMITKFQSTPPAWGATESVEIEVTFPQHFNPRPPHGGRLDRQVHRIRRRAISIHAPRMGGDRLTLIFAQIA